MNKDELFELLSTLTDEELDVINKLAASKKSKEQKKKKDSIPTHTIKGTTASKAKNKPNPSKSVKKSSKSKHDAKGKACNREPMFIDPNRPNKFEELLSSSTLDQSEQKELKIAEDLDKKTLERIPSFEKPKRRSTLIDVSCRVCGKEETVSASLVQKIDRYKCNECSTAACD